MNINALTQNEFEELVRICEYSYNHKIPRSVKSALFVDVISDPLRRFNQVQMRISTGAKKIETVLALRNPLLHKKMFR